MGFTLISRTPWLRLILNQDLYAMGKAKQISMDVANRATRKLEYMH